MSWWEQVEAWAILIGSVASLIYFVWLTCWLVREKRRGAW